MGVRRKAIYYAGIRVKVSTLRLGNREIIILDDTRGLYVIPKYCLEQK